MSDSHLPVSRRHLLQTAAGAMAAAAGSQLWAGETPEPKAASKGRIKQSIAQWCFAEHWTLPEMIQVAKRLGCPSIELVDHKDWPQLKENGLVCGLAMSHLFKEGMNNPKHWEMCIGKMKDSIDACAEFGFPNVLTFTGYRGDLTDEEGLKNCVEGYKKIVGYAEKKKITLCLEQLNTRDDTHPMKGHPGYQGDKMDFCLEIINQVGSPRLQFLFDVYHVQIMDGDVIRRIHQVKDHIAHVHVAGNPGRGELDAAQEINYPPVMQALLDIGYEGYVGQEFIPTRDPLAGLTEAVKVCDV